MSPFKLFSDAAMVVCSCCTSDFNSATSARSSDTSADGTGATLLEATVDCADATAGFLGLLHRFGDRFGCRFRSELAFASLPPIVPLNSTFSLVLQERLLLDTADSVFDSALGAAFAGSGVDISTTNLSACQCLGQCWYNIKHISNNTIG